MTCTEDREIGLVSGRLPDKQGEVACMPSRFFSFFFIVLSAKMYHQQHTFILLFFVRW